MFRNRGGGRGGASAIISSGFVSRAPVSKPPNVQTQQKQSGTLPEVAGVSSDKESDHAVDMPQVGDGLSGDENDHVDTMTQPTKPETSGAPPQQANFNAPVPAPPILSAGGRRGARGAMAALPVNINRTGRSAQNEADSNTVPTSTTLTQSTTTPSDTVPAFTLSTGDAGDVLPKLSAGSSGRGGRGSIATLPQNLAHMGAPNQSGDAGSAILSSGLSAGGGGRGGRGGATSVRGAPAGLSAYGYKATGSNAIPIGGEENNGESAAEQSYRPFNRGAPPKANAGSQACRYCKEEGHLVADCEKKKAADERKANQKCNRCGETGHFIRECSKEAPPDQQRKPGNESNRKTGYVPPTRAVDDIFGDDDHCKSLYSRIFDADEKVEVKGAGEHTTCIDNWSDVPLHPQLVKNIQRAGYVRPRKIQAFTIPLIIEGFDIKAQAETGGGKSAAFLIPLISAIAKEKETTSPRLSELHCPRAIIISPTRELVIQLWEQGTKLASETGVNIVRCYGDFDVRRNMEEVTRGSDIIVSTPGRLIHFLYNSFIGLDRLKYLVLDEADRLLDDGFKPDFDAMFSIQGFPKKDVLQTLLFSATYPPYLSKWMDSVLNVNHVEIKNVRANQPNQRVLQTFEECATNTKFRRFVDLCTELYAEQTKEDKNGEAKMPRMLVFVNSCEKADVLTFFINCNNIRAFSINSGRSQPVREQTLAEFHRDEINMIICTDVCARGLDFKEVDYVINLDMPKDIETYVHRIGRTGRLKSGRAHSFFDTQIDQAIAPALVKLLRNGALDVPDFLLRNTTEAIAPTNRTVPGLEVRGFD